MRERERERTREQEREIETGEKDIKQRKHSITGNRQSSMSRTTALTPKGERGEGGGRGPTLFSERWENPRKR